MDIEKIVDIVAEAESVTRNAENWREWRDYNNIGFPLARLLTYNVCELTEQGERLLQNSYDSLITALAIPPGEYNSFEEMLDTAIAQEG